MSASYVGIRDGKTVRLKRCEDCGEVKIVGEDRSSGFYVRYRPLRGGGRSPGWGPYCKVCVRRQKRERYAQKSPEEKRALNQQHWAKLKADPERFAVDLLRRREWLRRRREELSPEEYAAWMKRGRIARRAWEARKRSVDPDFFSRENRERRRQARIEAERRRREFFEHANGGTLPRVEAEPFREWAIAYMAATETIAVEAVADDLGIVAKTLSRCLKREQRKVALDVVDRALLSAPVEVEVDGRTIFTLDDLYPLGEVAAA